MTEDELDAFYEKEYRQVYQGSEGPTQKDLFVQNGRADFLLDFIDNRVHSVQRYLDIGCSTGILLERFRERYAPHVVGVEPGKAYRDYAKNQGLHVYETLGDVRSAGEDRFDLISMAHVLEHLRDPVAYLVDLRESYLSASGWLLIEVPNLYSHDSFEIAHMSSFSRRTLSQAVEKAGYQVESLKAHGQPRSMILPLYLTLLARPQGILEKELEIRVERNVTLKRRLGMLQRRVIQRVFPRKAWIPIPKKPSNVNDEGA
jgi:SAM-dependent methyltransferase